jgi:hypothetical protein
MVGPPRALPPFQTSSQPEVVATSGQHGIRICEELFWSWEIYQHAHERKELQRRIRLLRRELKPILRRYSGKAPRYKYTHGIARNLLKI